MMEEWRKEEVLSNGKEASTEGHRRRKRVAIDALRRYQLGAWYGTVKEEPKRRPVSHHGTYRTHAICSVI